MELVRIYSDDNGETHFEDLKIDLNSTNFAPPAPPVDLSSPTDAVCVLFFAMPNGWYGAAHPTPQRQLYFGIAGELEVGVSDGETRVFGAGDVVLLEDVAGAGHTTRVASPAGARGAFVQLPDRPQEETDGVIG